MPLRQIAVAPFDDRRSPLKGLGLRSCPRCPIRAPWKTSDNFWLKGVQIAGNFTWGNESGLTSAQGRTEARTPNRFVCFAAQPAQGDRLRYGGDLAWLVGPAAVKFQYDVQTNQRHGLGPQGSDLDKETAKGWYVSATYLLTGEEKRLSAGARWYLNEQTRLMVNSTTYWV